MLDFNLLPWRENARIKKTQQLRQRLVLSMTLQLFIFGLLHWALEYQINELNATKSIYDQKLKHSLQIHHKSPAANEVLNEALISLMNRDFQSWQMLKTLLQTEAKFLCFNSLIYTQSHFMLRGMTASWVSLSQYIIQLKHNPLFTNMNSEIVQPRDARAGGHANVGIPFTININIHHDES